MLKIDPNNRAVRFLKDPWHLLAADIIPVLTAAYFTFKKLADFAAENVLDGLITPKGTTWLIGTGLAIIAYATILKVLLLFIAKFEVPVVSSTDYSSLLHLYKKNNLEIEQHLADIKMPEFNKQSFSKFHTFNPNINLLVFSLNEHLRAVLSCSSGRLRQRDICISFYQLCPSAKSVEKGQCFKLTTHYDPASFEVKTLEIFTNDDAFKGFAGLKALSEGVPVCIPNCSGGGYVKAGVKRRKHVKQYFGVPMEASKETVALLNIEIHHKDCFASAKQMEEFFSEHLYPFKCLFEYQLLKRNFFTELSPRITP